MDVVIFGCGPAGLMAAHGAIAGGADTLRIISKKRKSELFGAQYLHAPIPGAPHQDSVLVDYMLTGDPDAYRVKIYGETWDGMVSPEDLAESHNAWDIRATYDWLWDRYERNIADVELRPSEIKLFTDNADVVVSTIPRSALCMRGHTFGSADVLAAGDAPARGISIPYTCADNTVLCNGNEFPHWYRLSNIFGHKTVEWPMSDVTPPVNGAAVVRKPTFHNCDCHPNLVYAGRYGRWEKGVLSHSAYQDALGAVEFAAEADKVKR